MEAELETKPKEAQFHEVETKLVDSLEDKFAVMEVFGPTIQGEGMMIGEKTLFIRMGGCDYRCAKCDSMHAVDPASVKANARYLNSEQIVTELASLGQQTHTKWITISGGNPAMWDLSLVVKLLKDMGFRIAVETQGSIWRDWLGEADVLTICPKGPGMGERFNNIAFHAFLQKVEGNYNRMMGRLAVCIKSVVFDQNDFEFAVGLDDILRVRNEAVGAAAWPMHDRYLSLGNPFPPKLVGTQLVTDEVPRQAMQADLLDRYAVLLEDYLQDPRLAHWKFLPQLHVLVWANKAEV